MGVQISLQVIGSYGHVSKFHTELIALTLFHNFSHSVYIKHYFTYTRCKAATSLQLGWSQKQMSRKYVIYSSYSVCN